MNRKARRAARNDKRPEGSAREQATESASDAVQAQIALGKRLAQQGDFSGALAVIEEALRSEPSNVLLHMLRGRVLNSLWRPDEATLAFGLN